ncbi:MAG: arginine deiminase family protein [Gemmatimonadales bacterium]|nr:arginine deiminase family protein [Gemmatimonadales bacterium]
MNFSHAITCPPSASYADGITTAGLGAPDLALALEQHAAYCAALEALGVRVEALPADPAHPDSCFVEDTAVVTANGAILARPGAPSRAGEVTAMRSVLQRLCGEPAAITAPGTLDGGDICQVGSHFLIGLSDRTNESGAEQLSRWLHGLGYTAETISIRGNPLLLHLKSGIAWLGGDDLVVVEALATHPALQRYRLLVVPDADGYAANCVRVNDAVLMAAGYPELTARVEALGYRVVTLEMSEFRKMDGGLSCLSVRI